MTANSQQVIRAGLPPRCYFPIAPSSLVCRWLGNKKLMDRKKNGTERLLPQCRQVVSPHSWQTIGAKRLEMVYGAICTALLICHAKQATLFIGNNQPVNRFPNLPHHGPHRPDNHLHKEPHRSSLSPWVIHAGSFYRLNQAAVNRNFARLVSSWNCEGIAQGKEKREKARKCLTRCAHLWHK